MEEVIENMLGFGRFQKCVTVLIGSTSILSAMAVYSTVFTDAYPNKPSSDNLCVSNDTNVSCESLANQTQVKPNLLLFVIAVNYYKIDFYFKSLFCSFQV